MTTKKLLTAVSLLCLSFAIGFAQGPNGSNTYYQEANGKKGAELKTELHAIIPPHTNIGYDGLYEAYRATDTRPDGYVRDWYSNATYYTHVKDKAGTYHKEGDCYNREHSVPQSWFQDCEKSSIIKADIVHVLPTDGYVNNRRGNYPLAKVGTWTYRSANDYSKLGNCATPGYNGTVFEPNDEIKGDMARIYFYMATCYEDVLDDWAKNTTANIVFDGTTYPAFKTWYLDMLMEWSKQDPIDAVEIARNNAVKEEQGNRNPFVDYPGLEDYIWGEWKDVKFSYDNYVIPYEGETPTTVSTPTFSLAGGTYTTEQTVTISCATSGATIYYTTNGSKPSTSSTMYNGAITISETTTLKAIAVKDGRESSVAEATYTINTGGGDEPTPSGNGSFTKVTSASQLVAGYEYVLVAETSKKVMNSTAKSTYFEGSKVEISNNTIAYDESMLVLTLGGSSGAWTFQNGSNYLVSTGAKKVSLSTSSAAWTISTDFTATPKTSSYGTLQYNAKDPRFTTYTSAQEAAVLYYRIPKTTLLGDVNEDKKVTIADVTALVNVLLGKDASGYDRDAADVNEDKKVTIADVTALVNILLGKK